MVGLILLYFVGKAFYDLAGLHNRSQWGFAILGVASYYAGQLLGGVLLGIISELGVFSLDGMSDMTISLMALPMGVLSCWGTYVLLKSQWSKAAEKVNREDVLDGDLIE